MPNGTGTPLIRVEGLKKSYVSGEVETPVLKGVSFGIEKGEFIAIMGPSGSGKSTLMHILGFLDHATEGRYEFDGQDVSSLVDDDLARMRRERVGFVFQSFFLLPELSVLENVKLALAYHDIPEHERVARAEEAVADVGLAHRRDYSVTRISGGEKQRVAIARALVSKPAVIFADEPTGNLDSKSGGVVMELLEDLNDKGNTIILVTHEKETAEHARRILSIRDGFIEGDVAVQTRKSSKNGNGLQK
ncbi:MAG: ABC transporter ATP-binding protein [Patescibacteria group bacterium]|nr:MAG: ABC transporter ATP-binding protein [Patescibacteria group bacterium]